MEPRLRPLLPEDRASLELLLCDVCVFTPEEVAVALELIDIALDQKPQDDYHFRVAELRGHAAGYACYGPTPLTDGTWDLYWLAVAPTWQRRKIGTVLLLAAETAVVENRGRLLIVETSSQRPYEPTRRFYERHGYAIIARIPDFYRPGDDKLIYRKRLAP